MVLTPNLRGALFMSLSMAGFTFNDTIIKFLSSGINMGQIIFMRGAIATVIIFMIARHRGALRPLKLLVSRWVLLRVIGELGGTVTFIIALSHIPIATASAILQALPLSVTMAAALFLAEPVGWRRWMAILVGFMGVMIIVRPGSEAFSPFALLVVGTVMFATMRDIATRRIDTAIPSLFLSTVTAGAVAIGGLCITMPMGGFTAVDSGQFGLVAMAACLTLVGYQFIIMSMREGEISFVAPFRYTSFIWSVLLGYLVFGDVPDNFMIIGGTIVVGSGLYTLYREQVRHGREIAARAPARPTP